MDIKELDIISESLSEHWYYQSKAKALSAIIKPYSPQKILDIGAGSGFFSEHIITHTPASESWCIDTAYTLNYDKSIPGGTIHYRKHIDTSNADFVLLIDVLEHVDNDIALLQEYCTKTLSNSLFLISVPAFNFLWSCHDVFLEHKRRYTLRQLERTVRKSGLSIIHSFYYFALVFPIAAGSRLLEKISPPKKPRSQLTPHPVFVNKCLSMACSAELPLAPFNRLFGLSVFCLARKA